MKPMTNIQTDRASNISVMLSPVLAYEMNLYLKTRNFQWNISNDSFMDIHELLEEQYKQIEECIHEIADRLKKFGESTMVIMNEFILSGTTGKEKTVDQFPKSMLLELLTEHESLANQLQVRVNNCIKRNQEIGTAYFLSEIVEQHMTIIWKLKKYLN
jgi:starvation-inducible DNA-binding protein